MIKRLLWAALATIASQPAIARRIIERAQRTPYTPIKSRDGTQIYMRRWWLFNPYGKDAQGNETPAQHAWLPSVRVHHICLPDDDQHEHDHPWCARTIVLHGWYMEARQTHRLAQRMVRTGDTHAITARDFHRITMVSTDGAYTLFFTWRFVEDWGFYVDGHKVPWRVYLGGRG